MNEQLIKPYGDTMNDGITQLSFTLPVENGPRAKKAAEIYVAKLNFDNISIVCAKKVSENFTFFVVYARALPVIDYSQVIATEVESVQMDYYQINEMIHAKLNRKIIVVGASIGTDAHTVGIDAIMNMKGYYMDYGLERYPQMEAYNMGAQVSSEALLEKALAVNADAILVSQTVTQKDAHLRNFTEFIELLEAENLRNRFIVIAGGARVTNDLAIELGYEAGFGPGTLPSNVASYILTTLLKRNGISL